MIKLNHRLLQTFNSPREVIYSCSHRAVATKAKPKLSNRQLLLDLIEDSPYAFQRHHPFDKVNASKLMQENDLLTGFKIGYQQLLLQMSEKNYDALNQILEPSLYNDVKEYLEEQITLNDAKLEVLNMNAPTFEVHKINCFFQAGLHIDRNRNDKEQIIPYEDKVEKKKDTIDLQLYMSKAPIKYRDQPLNLVFELHYKTNVKLNLIRGGSLKLIEKDEALTKPEFHSLRFEGLVFMFNNSVDSIVRMRNKYKKQRDLIEKGELVEVQEWKITDIDNWVKRKH